MRAEIDNDERLLEGRDGEGSIAGRGAGPEYGISLVVWNIARLIHRGLL